MELSIWNFWIPRCVRVRRIKNWRSEFLTKKLRKTLSVIIADSFYDKISFKMVFSEPPSMSLNFQSTISSSKSLSFQTQPSSVDVNYSTVLGLLCTCFTTDESFLCHSLISKVSLQHFQNVSKDTSSTNNIPYLQVWYTKLWNEVIQQLGHLQSVTAKLNKWITR